MRLEWGHLESGSGDGGFVPFLDADAQDAVGDFAGHFGEQQPEVGALAVVGGGDVFDAVGVGGELEACYSKLSCSNVTCLCFRFAFGRGRISKTLRTLTTRPPGMAACRKTG